MSAARTTLTVSSTAATGSMSSSSDSSRSCPLAVCTAQMVDYRKAKGQREAVFVQSVACRISFDDPEEAPVRNRLQIAAVKDGGIVPGNVSAVAELPLLRASAAVARIRAAGCGVGASRSLVRMCSKRRRLRLISSSSSMSAPFSKARAIPRRRGLRSEAATFGWRFDSRDLMCCENLVAFLLGPFRHLQLLCWKGEASLDSLPVVLCACSHDKLAAHPAQLRAEFSTDPCPVLFRPLVRAVEEDNQANLLR